MTLARVLTIAGSDSSGGAGIQADLKTFSALGTFGMTVITALTAQNTTGVTGVVELDPAFIELQIDAVFSDIGVDAVKTGMLSSVPIIELVARKLRELRPAIVVVDPVMIAKSGAPLLRDDAVDAVRTQMLPFATVVTPNRYEAEALSGRPIRSRDDLRAAARAIHALGPRFVVVKGRSPEVGASADRGRAIDLLYDGQTEREYGAEYFETRALHGSGCIFAAAITAELAKGQDVPSAVATAKAFITEAIRHGVLVGHGFHPANPMAQLYLRAGLPPA